MKWRCNSFANQFSIFFPVNVSSVPTYSHSIRKTNRWSFCHCKCLFLLVSTLSTSTRIVLFLPWLSAPCNFSDTAGHANCNESHFSAAWNVQHKAMSTMRSVKIRRDMSSSIRKSNQLLSAVLYIFSGTVSFMTNIRDIQIGWQATTFLGFLLFSGAIMCSIFVLNSCWPLIDRCPFYLISSSEFFRFKKFSFVWALFLFVFPIPAYLGIENSEMCNQQCQVRYWRDALVLGGIMC
jgi:hypothetical protein